jgi:hypothetical protein
MEQPRITFIVNNNTYSLRATDSNAIRDIPSADRAPLIELLDAVRQQETLSQSVVQNAVDRSRNLSQVNAGRSGPGAVAGRQDPKPERLGSGDVDALMARLALEEKHKQKPGLTKRGVYKLVAGFAIGVLLLVLIF